MIVLNSEKEIIRVEAWEDIVTRPGFNRNLNPEKHALESIIGRYAFRDYVPCGLSNCHTPHGRGYIVVTKDGHETNIGKDCGKTYFGVDFETLSNKFDRDITEKENREKLWSFFFRSEEFHAKVTTIRTEENGANWVYRETSNLLNPQKVPSKAIRRINSMVKARDSRLFQDREATEDEIEQMERAQGRRIRERPQYVSIPLGQLQGLDALYPENNLRVLLVEELEERLKLLGDTNIDALSFEDLRKWSKWLGSLDALFERATQSVKSGRMLLTQANLGTLSDAASLSTEEHSMLGAYLRTLPRERPNVT